MCAYIMVAPTQRALSRGAASVTNGAADQVTRPTL